jgi:peptide deformylase
MAILEIRTFPDPVLKKKAEPVKKVTPQLAKLAEDMLETMYAAPGVGLAANQIGITIRLVVIDTRPTDEDGKVIEDRMTALEREVKFPLILFNPEIIVQKGGTSWEEGCLSVPGYIEDVKRPEYVEIKALNEKGEVIEIKTDGLLAICIQHEIDHLDGKLFLDRLSPIKRNMIKSKIKKNGYSDASKEDTHSAL